MNTVSLIGSVSRLAGGLFESVRRLHQELLGTQTVTSVNFLNASVSEIRVKVLGLRDQFSAQDLQAWEPVSIEALGIAGPRTFGYAPGLRQILRRSNPGLVHVHGLWQYGSLATVLWHRKARKPYVVSPHGMLDAWALKHSRLKKRVAWLVYERSHLQRAACIRALCQAELRAIRALGLRNPVCLIPNGIDVINTLEPLTTLRQSSEKGRRSVPARILLFLGRIHPKKGLAPLLQAWAKVGRSSGWALVIAGWDQGGHEADLKQLAGDLGLLPDHVTSDQQAAGSVSFIGPQFGDAKRKLLQRCQAVILPSFSEGVPMAILEAWANAKPALITPYCNLPEGVLANAAITIEPNPDSIAAGLQILFGASNSTLEKFSARGQELVLRKFSWPKIVSDLKAVYLWLGHQAPRPECVVN